MKHALNVISILLLAWIVGGGSTGYRTVAPLTPSADVPVWGREDPIKTKAKNDVRDGFATLSPEDEARKEKAVFLYKIIKKDPCNQDARKELAAILVSYIKELKSSFAGDDAKSEYEHSVKLQLNKDITEMLVESYEEGYLVKEDYPFIARAIIGPFLPSNETVSRCERLKAEEERQKAQ